MGKAHPHHIAPASPHQLRDLARVSGSPHFLLDIWKHRGLRYPAETYKTTGVQEVLHSFYIQLILCLLNKFCICLWLSVQKTMITRVLNEVWQQRSTVRTRLQWMQGHALQWFQFPSEVLGWFRAVVLKRSSPDSSSSISWKCVKTANLWAPP